MNLFDLVAVLTLNKKDYEEGLDEAQGEATSFGDKLKSGLGTAAKVAGAVTGAAVAAGAGIVKLASSSATAMDEIDKSSQKMGISIEAYQEWAHAMDLSGMSIDTMKNGMKSLQKAMTGVDEDGNATSEEFQKLGISLVDASGNMRSAEDVMNDAILALSNMDESAERTAIATKLFGRAGMELGPLLNSGADAIAAMKQEAHDLGLVMSEDDVKAGAQLNDTLSNLKQSFSAIITRLGNALMPIVQKIGDFLIKNMPKIQDMFDKIAPLLLDLAEQLLPILIEVAEAILPTLFTLIETLMPTFNQIVQSILPIIVTALQAINPLLQILTAILKPILDLINLIVKPLLDLVNFIFKGLTDGISGIADGLGENGLFGVLSKVGEAFATIFGGIGELLSEPLEAIKDFFGGIWDTCSKIMGWVWDKVTGVFQGIYEFLDWINPFSDSEEERAAHASTANFLKGKASSLQATAEQYAKDQAFVQQYGTWGSNNTTEIKGELTVKGVSNEGEFLAAADYTMDQITKQMQRDSRLYTYGG